MSGNPDAPPHTEELPPHEELQETPRATTRVRQEHLHHESRVRASALFFFVIGVGIVAISLIGLQSDMSAGPHMTGKLMPTKVLLVMGTVSVLCGWVGWALRRLDRRVLVPGTLLASLFLLFLPIGTGLGIYILWLLHSRKGRVVLSAEYAQVRAATPHIVYRTGKIDWIILFAVLALLATIIGGLTLL